MAELFGGSSVSVIVYDSAITAMNMPGGMVNDYIKDKGGKAAAYAKEMAPKRTGTLARSVRREKVQWSRTRVHVRVSARAKHAIWVIEGTGDPMISVDDTGEGFFYMPRRKNSPHYRRFYYDIRGQKANNFLERAASAAVATPYMRGARLSGNPFG